MKQSVVDYYRWMGENIAYYRIKKRLNQEGLALRVGISRGYLSQIEAAGVKTNPTLDVIFCICEILDISPSQLFEEPLPKAKRIRIDH